MSGINPVLKSMVASAVIDELGESGQVGRTEKKYITWDGETGEKSELLSNLAGVPAYKMSDEPIEPSTITMVRTRWFNTATTGSEEYDYNKLKFEESPNVVILNVPDINNGAGWEQYSPFAYIVLDDISEELEDGTTAEIPKGVYFLLYSDGTTGKYLNSLEYETIHPIDQKYLPGVCLPVVELTTELSTIGTTNVLNENDSAALDSVIASGAKFVLLSVRYTNFYACQIVRKLDEEDGADGFSGTFIFPGVIIESQSRLIVGLVIAKDPETNVWYFSEVSGV